MDGAMDYALRVTWPKVWPDYHDYDEPPPDDHDDDEPPQTVRFYYQFGYNHVELRLLIDEGGVCLDVEDIERLKIAFNQIKESNVRKHAVTKLNEILMRLSKGAIKCPKNTPTNFLDVYDQNFTRPGPDYDNPESTKHSVFGSFSWYLTHWYEWDVQILPDNN
tara:strand:+ start:142 stop:630 length:489 start_codon:yes stop_codon:yes gene_type:complete